MARADRQKETRNTRPLQPFSGVEPYIDRESIEDDSKV